MNKNSIGHITHEGPIPVLAEEIDQIKSILLYVFNFIFVMSVQDCTTGSAFKSV